MNKPSALAPLLACVSTLAVASAAHAQDTRGFSWVGSVEIGVESVFDSDDPANEVDDTYPTIELGAEFAVSDRVTFFGGLTLEPVLDPVNSRTFDDLGLYVSELGVRFDLDAVTLSVGKLSPVFGMAWDVTPGYFGTSIPEDYEISEAIGVIGELGFGNLGGTVSLALFYADDTHLSDSFGRERGRNTSANGGAGNTGELNNAAITFSQTFGGTTLIASARHLEAGDGDPSDEDGLALGIAHDFGNGLSLMGELASFNGYGGTTDDATYATLGASYGVGNWSYSAAYTRRDIDSSGVDDMMSVGLDYEFASGVSVGGGLAVLDESGLKSKAVGMSVVFPLGG